jgi:LCP family protein required for cell wall assembly
MAHGQGDGEPGTRSQVGGRGGRPWQRHSTRSVVLASLAILLAVVVVGGSLTAYVTLRADWNAIHRVNVLPDLGKQRPPADPNALNILLIGSDSRAGSNKKFGAEVQGQRSDTVMVVHVSPGAHQVVVLSFPRDSVVPILSCSAEPGAAGQQARPGQIEQINATFAYGGPGCLWKTIEQTAGIHLNDFIELTFTGFEHVIDDIGGVNVCLPVAVNDPDSKLDLSAGEHHVYGAQALAFWRARYIGEGSDLQRIQRDQFLMASLLQGIQRSGLIHSPAKILRVIQDVAGRGYVTTDTQLTVGRLVTIADELRGLPPGSVQFIEIPAEPYPGDPEAWVQWEQPQADSLFAAIAHDTTLPKAKPARPARTPSKAAAPVLDSVKPAQVDVTVLNGSTLPGLATATANSLTALGFNVVGPPGDAGASDYTNSVIEYAASADLPAAETLARLISHVTLQLDPGLTSGTLQLILGSDFTKLALPAAAPSSGTQNLVSQYGGITGNAQICGDADAFAGPDGDN